MRKLGATVGNPLDIDSNRLLLGSKEGVGVIGVPVALKDPMPRTDKE